MFLMADAVTSARSGQKTPDGFYNVERMLKRVLAGNGKVLLCGTCMDARGLGKPPSCRARAGAPWMNSRRKRRRPTRFWYFDLAAHLSRLQRKYASRSGGRRCDDTISF